MKIVSLFNEVALEYEVEGTIKHTNINSIVVPFGYFELDDLDGTELQAEQVLVRKLAFSVNYRDKAMIQFLYLNGQQSEEFSYTGFGSDFVAEVVAVGSLVTQFQVGDRVIPDGHYPHAKSVNTMPGIPTNCASEGMEIFHQEKLCKVPHSMPIEVAGGITVGAQTTYGMVRRLEIKAGSNVLVTAGKSNTSLFALAALKATFGDSIQVYALTSNNKGLEIFERLGAKPLVVDRDNLPESLAKAVGSLQFQYVIDPLSDVYLMAVLNHMDYFAKYITCGVARQDDLETGGFSYPGSLIPTIMMKNISIIGNCLGETQDLQNAISDYEAGKLDIVIDQVFEGDTVTDFINRSYNDSEKVGKVIYKM